MTWQAAHWHCTVGILPQEHGRELQLSSRRYSSRKKKKLPETRTENSETFSGCGKLILILFLSFYLNKSAQIWQIRYMCVALNHGYKTIYTTYTINIWLRPSEKGAYGIFLDVLRFLYSSIADMNVSWKMKFYNHIPILSNFLM